jgi:transposase
MSLPKIILIKESTSELKSLLKSSIPMIAIRIRCLLELKKHEQGISKRELAEIIGVNHNSIQSWRNLYNQGGISAITSHNKVGHKPNILSNGEHLKIEEKLNDPKNGLRGYVELQNWIEKELGKTIKYNTLLKYSMRHFGSSVKVARKSHVNKDMEKVDTFKKTSVISVKN